MCEYVCACVSMCLVVLCSDLYSSLVSCRMMITVVLTCVYTASFFRVRRMCCECTAGHRRQSRQVAGDCGRHGQVRAGLGRCKPPGDGDGGRVRGQHSCFSWCSCAVASRRSLYGVVNIVVLVCCSESSLFVWCCKCISWCSCAVASRRSLYGSDCVRSCGSVDGSSLVRCSDSSLFVW
jgi:hypothetical protein